MRILISNDDGVYAPGLQSLRKELSRDHEVWVVAPLDEKSTSGHSLTLHTPLRMIEVEKKVFGVSGSPADSVLMAFSEVLTRKPDLIISGINRGANLGQDVFYSGTVSAAREAVMHGYPALAVSLAVKFGKPNVDLKAHYDSAAKITRKLIKKLTLNDFPKGVLLNLNVPDLPLSRIKGVQIVRQGTRHYSGGIVRRTDHRGRKYYWVGGKYKGFKELKGTDVTAVASRYAALCPHKLDTTDTSSMKYFGRKLEDLKI